MLFYAINTSSIKEEVYPVYLPARSLSFPKLVVRLVNVTLSLQPSCRCPEALSTDGPASSSPRPMRTWRSQIALWRSQRRRHPRVKIHRCRLAAAPQPVPRRLLVSATDEVAAPGVPGARSRGQARGGVPAAAPPRLTQRGLVRGGGGPAPPPCVLRPCPRRLHQWPTRVGASTTRRRPVIRVSTTDEGVASPRSPCGLLRGGGSGPAAGPPPSSRGLVRGGGPTTVAAASAVAPAGTRTQRRRRVHGRAPKRRGPMAPRPRSCGGRDRGFSRGRPSASSPRRRRPRGRAPSRPHPVGRGLSMSSD